MGLLDVFKKDKKEAEITKAPEQGKADKVAAKQEEKRGKLLKDDKADKKVKTPTNRKEDTKNAYKVLIKPLITEKATATNTYLFAVNPKTNKQEIKKAIQVVYGVKPLKINIINFSGRGVRWGKSTGKTKSWKKAIVYLKEGESIQTFEGV
ncbi:MAG: 50S ribosomal protein L23 [Patescibacteria group bacterium]